jgi:hypothetical protein
VWVSDAERVWVWGWDQALAWVSDAVSGSEWASGAGWVLASVRGWALALAAASGTGSEWVKASVKG